MMIPESSPIAILLRCTSSLLRSPGAPISALVSNLRSRQNFRLGWLVSPEFRGPGRGQYEMILAERTCVSRGRARYVSGS
jgi:hypothetical protein